MTTVVVFGGTGFLGRRLVHRLTGEWTTVRVAVRHPDQMDVGIAREPALMNELDFPLS